MFIYHHSSSFIKLKWTYHFSHTYLLNLITSLYSSSHPSVLVFHLNGHNIQSGQLGCRVGSIRCLSDCIHSGLCFSSAVNCALCIMRFFFQLHACQFEVWASDLAWVQLVPGVFYASRERGSKVTEKCRMGFSFEDVRGVGRWQQLFFSFHFLVVFSKHQ